MLHVDKVDSLQTERLLITASGLKKTTCYKFTLKMHHENGTHSSHCVIRSGCDGKIDLTTDKPIRGTYHDADPMGLFLSLQPMDDVPFGKPAKFNLTRPVHYTLQLRNETEHLIDEKTLRKHFLHPLVSEIKTGPYTIFKPPGPGPFPCILFIPGAYTVQIDRTAPILASEGFVVLTFLHQDLKNSKELELDVFEGPIQFVKTLPYSSGKIGLFGKSLGGALSHYLSLKHSGISAVCAINGTNSFSRIGLREAENGSLVMSEEAVEAQPEVVNGIVNLAKMYRNVENLIPKLSMPWENASKETAFRVVVSDISDPFTIQFQCSLDDWIVNLIPSSYEIRQTLQRKCSVEINLLPAGHIINPPYLPHQSFHSDKSSLRGIGGECLLHSKSQESVWRRNVEFFKKYLGVPPKIPDWKRETAIRPNTMCSKL